jgi:UDP-N-acetylglucosamine transferase subunit ALG13
VIFVTVGTTLPFDDLIAAVDRLVETGAITEPVTCQIGHGNYVPLHCEHFGFTAQIDDYLDRASLVVGHGGTGTVTGLLASGKPFVVVANPLGAGNHQAQFLARLSELVSFLWTADVAELGDLIRRARHFTPSGAPGKRLTEDLRRFLLTAGPRSDRAHARSSRPT